MQKRNGTGGRRVAQGLIERGNRETRTGREKKFRPNGMISVVEMIVDATSTALLNRKMSCSLSFAFCAAG